MTHTLTTSELIRYLTGFHLSTGLPEIKEAAERLEELRAENQRLRAVCEKNFIDAAIAQLRAALKQESEAGVG